MIFFVTSLETFTDLAIVLPMFMLSLIFVIVVLAFYYLLYLYKKLLLEIKLSRKGELDSH
jgi:hypothetical protein